MSRRQKRHKIRVRLILAIAQRDGWNCQLCENPFTDFSQITIDHIFERSVGGRDGINNKQLAHPECNVGKSSYLSVRKIQKKKALCWEGAPYLEYELRTHFPANWL